ncbi:MAG TPA: STAS domain-containing protein [Terriglobales bacterium]|nr:STAS domain-containing protein [Terriglobales bacterium]
MHPGQVVMVIRGPLTLENLFRFQDAWRGQTAPSLILDLADVPYVDSAGIGSLVHLHVSREKAGGSLALVAVAPRVRETFKVTHVDQTLKLFAAISEAEAALAAHG